MSLRTLVSLFALALSCTELPPPPRRDATGPSDTPPPPIDATDATLADLVDAPDTTTPSPLDAPDLTDSSTDLDTAEATVPDVVTDLPSDASLPSTSPRLTGTFVSSAIPTRPGDRLSGGFVWTAPLRTTRLEAWLR